MSDCASTLAALRPGITIAEWCEIVRTLRDARRSITGAEVKAISWGVDVYGEDAYQVLDQLGYEHGTIANYLSIARRVSPRLIEAGYSVSQLGEVRALPHAEQVQVMQVAQSNGWNRDELRGEVARRVGRTVTAPALETERDTVDQIRRLWGQISKETRAKLLRELRQ